MNATDDNRGISIAGAKIIDGNGHTIDAAGRSRIFDINASNVVLSNIVFKNAHYDISGALNYGGAIIWAGSNGTLNNCTFINCSSRYGGAIYWLGDNGNVNDCYFAECSQRNDGGALYWVGQNSRISNTDFNRCYNMMGNGGIGTAIYFNSNNAKITDCSFTNCSTTGFKDGAIYWLGENGTLSDSVFNNCSSTNGGAVNWHASNGVLDNCYFENCFASGRGGAIFWDADNGVVSNSNFMNCSASIAGAIEWNRDYAINGARYGIITNCNFINCNQSAIDAYADFCTVSDCNFYGCYNDISGGAIIWNGDNGVLENSNFVDCYASYAGAIHWRNTNGTVDNCNFTDCFAFDGDGGSVYVDGGFKNLTLNNSNFINSWANRDGGAVFWSGGNGNVYTLNNSNFNNCSANRDGGAMCGDANAFNSNFDKCSAVRYAGAMNGGSATNCKFTNNKAKWGGAKYSTNGPTVNCDFIGNTAYDSIGAVYGNDIINCTFTDNSANSTGGSVGGAQKVLNCNFTDSYAKSGGAIYGAASVADCNFYNCHALGENGGAIHVDGYGEVIDNCNFTDCSSNASGGAVYKSGNAGAVYNSNFVNCTAGVNGGAVRGTNSENCSFKDNSADKGGALAGGSAKDCTFYGNKATTEGNNWYETKVPKLNLNVNDFHSIYASGDAIFLNATENNVAVDNVIITIRVTKKDNSFNETYASLTNTNWPVDLDAGAYAAKMTVEHNAYELDKTISLTIDKRPTSITASDVSTVYAADDYLIVTLKDFEGNNVSGKTISVDLNGVKNYTTDDNGQITVPTNEIPAGNYTAAIAFDGTFDNFDSSSTNINVTVEKAATSIASNAVSTVYNGGKYLVATLKDVNGNVISGVLVSTNIKTFKSVKTDNNGQVKWLTNGLAPIKTYSVVMTFAGNDNYVGTTKKVTVKVTKATPKLTAKAKSFKRSDKTKKYTITLKTNQNKALSGAKVTIKVNKKTYTAVTNKKGQATFKLSKLTKKGKFSATVKYVGNKYYTVKSVKAKITVK